MNIILGTTVLPYRRVPLRTTIARINRNLYDYSKINNQLI